MRKKKPAVAFDPFTEQISRFLEKVPILRRLYLWKYMMFNFMIVGSSGLVLSWIIYEGFLRSLMVDFLGGTFLGMVITTFLVFCWNYFWNKKWSLGINSQICGMKKDELQQLLVKVKVLLEEKFDYKGKRIS